jgi:ribosome-binding ATPase YchF (GTP1/OBG family)
MSLKIGIVGLPNVGKSTLFKALTKKQVDIANFPFTTVDPNIAVVPVLDRNLDKLAEIFKPDKVTPATIEFVDIAGLVKEAHLGKGLGNQFLAEIRETNIIVEVVRVFSAQGGPASGGEDQVAHVEGSIDPERDIKIIEKELKEAEIEKPTIYVFNVGSDSDYKIPEGVTGLAIPVKDDMEIAELSEEERKELGMKTSGLLDELIRICYDTLDLITFYTIKGGKEVRATKIKKGSGILEAAGDIHSDFRENFAKAEVVGVGKLIENGSWQGAREKGLIRTEGKEYIVQDGDVMEFKI